MDIRMIINALMEHLGIKKDKDFANFLGIKPSTLSTWYARNSMDYELVFAKCEDVDANWLLSGKGNMLKGESSTEDTSGSIKKLTSTDVSLDHLRMLTETHAALMGSQATISKTAQAAIDAAQSAAKTADLLATRFGIIEEKTADDAAMIRGIQEVLVTFVAPRLPNTSPQEIGAALGNAVIRSAAEAKKKKKGTRTAASR